MRKGVEPGRPPGAGGAASGRPGGGWWRATSPRLDSGPVSCSPQAWERYLPATLQPLFRRRTPRCPALVSQPRVPPGEYDIVDGFVEENPGITEASARYVKQLARGIETSGARFILMVVPSRYRLRHPEEVPHGPEFSDRWSAWAAAEGIAFFDLAPSFQAAAARGVEAFLEGDVHFSRDGHAVMAEALREAYPQLLRGP